MFLIAAFLCAALDFGKGAALLIIFHVFFESSRNFPYRSGGYTPNAK